MFINIVVVWTLKLWSVMYGRTYARRRRARDVRRAAEHAGQAMPGSNSSG